MKKYSKPFIKNLDMNEEEDMLSISIDLGDGNTGTVSDEPAGEPAGAKHHSVWDD